MFQTIFFQSHEPYYLKNNTCSYHITALTILKHLSFSNYTVGILQQCGITYEKKLEKPSKNHHPPSPPTGHVMITPWMIPCPTNSNAKCWWWQRLGTMKLGCVNGEEGISTGSQSALKEHVEKKLGYTRVYSKLVASGQLIYGCFRK